MVETVKKLLSMDVGSVISSPASLELIRCYSQLYCNGRLCKGCADAQRSYYRQLEIDGIEKAINYTKMIQSTCLPIHKGIVQVKDYGIVNLETITDEQAIYLLKHNLLPESFFVKLPEGYRAEKEVEPVNEVAEATQEIEPAQPKQRKPRTKNQ